MHRLVLSSSFSFSSSSSPLCRTLPFIFHINQSTHIGSRQFSTSSNSQFSRPLRPVAPPPSLLSHSVALLSSPSWFTSRWYAHSAAPASGGIQPFLLTDVGEGIAEVEIINFYVKVGDKISEFDRVCEVQSDKATVEITSRFEGVVSKVYYQKGDIAKVGKPLIDVEPLQSSKSNQSSTPQPIPQPASPASQPTSQPTSQPASQQSSQPSASHDDQFSHSIRTSSGGTRKVLAAPAVRRIASEQKLTLSTILGSGKDGRVTKADVIRALEQPTQIPQERSRVEPTETVSTPESPVVSSISEQDREVPIRGYARAMVKTMTAAAKVPHFGYADELEVDDLVLFRKSLLRTANERGVEKLTLMPILLKALSLSLKAYPMINSQFKEESMSLIYKASHNIGIAMDTPSGLVVPNIKNCQNKSILEIAMELNRLSGLAKENKLSVADLTGGTITLSNVGTIGGTYTSPVLNLPEVAIGALGKIQTVPRFDSQGHVKPVQLIQLSWSADHRVLDGATIARFSTLFKRYIENPTSMLLECR